jgi:hypothetical protein
MMLHFLKAFIQLWKHGRLNHIQLCSFAEERIQTGNMATWQGATQGEQLNDSAHESHFQY